MISTRKENGDETVLSGYSGSKNAKCVILCSPIGYSNYSTTNTYQLYFYTLHTKAVSFPSFSSVSACRPSHRKRAYLYFLRHWHISISFKKPTSSSASSSSSPTNSFCFNYKVSKSNGSICN